MIKHLSHIFWVPEKPIFSANCWKTTWSNNQTNNDTIIQVKVEKSALKLNANSWSWDVILLLIFLKILFQVIYTELFHCSASFCFRFCFQISSLVKECRKLFIHSEQMTWYLWLTQPELVLYRSYLKFSPKKFLFRNILLNRVNYSTLLLVLNCPEKALPSHPRDHFVAHLSIIFVFACCRSDCFDILFSV